MYSLIEVKLRFFGDIGVGFGRRLEEAIWVSYCGFQALSVPISMPWRLYLFTQVPKLIGFGKI